MIEFISPRKVKFVIKNKDGTYTAKFEDGRVDLITELQAAQLANLSRQEELEQERIQRQIIRKSGIAPGKIKL